MTDDRKLPYQYPLVCRFYAAVCMITLLLLTVVDPGGYHASLLSFISDGNRILFTLFISIPFWPPLALWALRSFGRKASVGTFPVFVSTSLLVTGLLSTVTLLGFIGLGSPVMLHHLKSEGLFGSDVVLYAFSSPAGIVPSFLHSVLFLSAFLFTFYLIRRIPRILPPLHVYLEAVLIGSFLASGAAATIDGGTAMRLIFLYFMVGIFFTISPGVAQDREDTDAELRAHFSAAHQATLAPVYMHRQSESRKEV